MENTSDNNVVEDLYDLMSDSILEFGICLEEFKEKQTIDWINKHPELEFIDSIIHRLDELIEIKKCQLH